MCIVLGICIFILVSLNYVDVLQSLKISSHSHIYLWRYSKAFRLVFHIICLFSLYYIDTEKKTETETILERGHAGYGRAGFSYTG